jgi:predicted transcriptional regulator
MTSTAMMKRILTSMPDQAISTQWLADKMGRPVNRLRDDLVEMSELGLVEKMEIDEKGKHFSRRRVGWKRTVRLRSTDSHK